MDSRYHMGIEHEYTGGFYLRAGRVQDDIQSRVRHGPEHRVVRDGHCHRETVLTDGNLRRWRMRTLGRLLRVALDTLVRSLVRLLFRR